MITTVVPHKALTEISKPGTVGVLTMHGWQSESGEGVTDQKWSDPFSGMFAMVAVVTSPTHAGCNVV